MSANGDGGADDELVEIIVTAPDHDWLVALADELLDEHLIAAAHVIPGVMTVYDWNGERHHETESRAALHTPERLSAVVLERVEREHPYAVPGVFILASVHGRNYLSWVLDQTRAATAPD